MVERLPSPTRQHLYTVTLPGGFASVLDTQLSRHPAGDRRGEFESLTVR